MKNKLNVIVLILFCIICYQYWLIYNVKYPEPYIIKYNTESVNNIDPLKTQIKILTGIASWYDYLLEGEEWSKNHLTCATRDFKRYSYVKVTNLSNNESIVCYVNDYGPEEQTKRLIDLSSYAFSKLALLSFGLINVSVEQL